jgi:hypothetical protein
MIPNKSLGGIGNLYLDDTLLGEVYYNIRQDQPPGSILCSMVFVGNDVELPDDKGRYRLLLEDGRYLLVTLYAARPGAYAPYLCASCDGIWHSELSYAHI